MAERTETAWWCPSRERLGASPPEKGTVDRFHGALEPGRSGLHASALLLDALSYGESPIVCCVELEGDVAIGVGQRCAELRRVVWVGDVTAVVEDLVATTLPPLFRRVLSAFEEMPKELVAIAERAEPDPRAVAELALGLRERVDDERRDAEWSGRDTVKIAGARQRAAAAHAAVLLTDEMSTEPAHLTRTAERIADAAAWLAYSWGDGSFDDERLVARVLTGAWLAAAMRARSDEVDFARFARRGPSRPEIVSTSQRPTAPTTEPAWEPHYGLSLFRTMMDLDGHREKRSCPSCGAVRRGVFSLDALCLACGASLRPKRAKAQPKMQTKTAGDGHDAGEQPPRENPEVRARMAHVQGRAGCRDCGAMFVRSDRPFLEDDTCPRCGEHEGFFYPDERIPFVMCPECRVPFEVEGVMRVDVGCQSCERDVILVPLRSTGLWRYAHCGNCGALAARSDRDYRAGDICPSCFAVDLAPVW